MTKAAIAIFFLDVTKKMKAKFNAKLAAEKAFLKKLAENFTSMINHEMQTPLASMLFFIIQIERQLEDRS